MGQNHRRLRVAEKQRDLSAMLDVGQREATGPGSQGLSFPPQGPGGADTCALWSLPSAECTGWGKAGLEELKDPLGLVGKGCPDSGR